MIRSLFFTSHLVSTAVTVLPVIITLTLVVDLTSKSSNTIGVDSEGPLVKFLKKNWKSLEYLKV